jgi:hypothetical protein
LGVSPALLAALLLAALVPSAAGAAAGRPRATAAGALRVQCSRRAGISSRECPVPRRAPSLYAYVLNTPMLPALVGNTYAINFGEWLSHHRDASLRVEWLDRHGRVVSRATHFTLTQAQIGQVLTARTCVSVAVAVGCVTLKLSAATQSVGGYLKATCGSSRPAPPPYDADFSFLSASLITKGGTPVGRSRGHSTTTPSRR